MVGIYVLRTPALLLRDPVLVKQVLITKFNNFRNNDNCYQMDGESDHVFGNNPFILKNDAWKVKRHQVVSAMSPARVLFLKFVASYYSFCFYNLQMKALSPVFDDVNNKFTNYVLGKINEDQTYSFEARNVNIFQSECFILIYYYSYSSSFAEDTQHRSQPALFLAQKQMHLLIKFATFTITV